MRCKTCFDYKKRIGRLQKQLSFWKKDGCIIDSPTDLFYLTGLELSAGRLVVLRGKAALFVDGRYVQAAREKSPVPVELFSSTSIAAFAKGKIVFDSACTTVEKAEAFKKICPKAAPLPALLKELRAIKDEKEIAALKKSACLLWKGYEHIRKIIKSGVSEEEIALEFEIFCRRNGASSLAFEPIIAFGENSAMPHYRAGKAKLKKGQIVLCDIGVVVDGYRSDMTRFFFFGKPDSKLEEMATVVRAAHKAALDVCRPGAKIQEIDEAARKIMRTFDMEKLFVHSLGHGIGLQTHEFPIIRYDGADKETVLKAGMAITIEPGLYKSGLGGVRYEDTIVITKGGYTNLYA